MILSSHQPNFLPYMGYFYKVMRSDIAVFSDDVTFSKSGMHNWNYILTKDGKKKLTLPVSAHHDTPLKDVKIADPERNIWKLSKTIEQEYHNAPHYDDGMEIVMLMRKMSVGEVLSLAQFNVIINRYIFRRFGFDTALRYGSTMGLHGHKDDRIILMCRRLHSNVYLSGTGAKAYHDESKYQGAGIELVFSDYVPVKYPQFNGGPEPNLSVIDYIMNCGFNLPRGWKKDE